MDGDGLYLNDDDVDYEGDEDYDDVQVSIIITMKH